MTRDAAGDPIEFTAPVDLYIEFLDGDPPGPPSFFDLVDFDIPLEKKTIGGLGIHFAREMMDDLIYKREHQKNIFTMKKRVPE